MNPGLYYTDNEDGILLVLLMLDKSDHSLRASSMVDLDAIFGGGASDRLRASGCIESTERMTSLTDKGRDEARAAAQRLMKP